MVKYINLTNNCADELRLAVITGSSKKLTFGSTFTNAYRRLILRRFTGDLQIQSRASLFSARSESNPVLILPLRNRIKTYHTRRMDTYQQAS